jgi:DNA repair exonuclease SbcCD ATPase subunit
MENAEKKLCPLCNRELTNQGFGGHMWAAHGVRIGEHAKLEDVNKRVIKLEDELSAKVAKLSDDLPGKLTKLEAQIDELRKLHTFDIKKGIIDGKHTAGYKS